MKTVRKKHMKFKNSVTFIAFVASAISASGADPTGQSDVIGHNSGVGHLGLYSGSNKKVCEILNDTLGLKNGSKKTCVHIDRSLTTFKSSSKNKFLGAKYVSGLSTSTLAKIHDNLKGQYLFNAKYSNLFGIPAAIPPLKFRSQAYNSSSLYYWDGYGNKKQGGGDSVLRCDFGVVAAYLDVTGKKYGWSGVPTPDQVFKAFPNTR